MHIVRIYYLCIYVSCSIYLDSAYPGWFPCQIGSARGLRAKYIQTDTLNTKTIAPLPPSGGGEVRGSTWCCYVSMEPPVDEHLLAISIAQTSTSNFICFRRVVNTLNLKCSYLKLMKLISGNFRDKLDVKNVCKI